MCSSNSIFQRCIFSLRKYICIMPIEFDAVEFWLICTSAAYPFSLCFSIIRQFYLFISCIYRFNKNYTLQINSCDLEMVFLFYSVCTFNYLHLRFHNRFLKLSQIPFGNSLNLHINSQHRGFRENQLKSIRIFQIVFTISNCKVINETIVDWIGKISWSF